MKFLSRRNWPRTSRTVCRPLPNLQSEVASVKYAAAEKKEKTAEEIKLETITNNIASLDEVIKQLSPTTHAPQLAVMYEKRSWLNQEIENWKEALSDCNKSIKFNPKPDDDSVAYKLYYRRAHAASIEGKPTKQVIFDFEKAFSLGKPDAVGLRRFAFALHETGQLQKAAQKIDESLKLDPANAEAFAVKSIIELSKGNTSEAFKLCSTGTGY